MPANITYMKRVAVTGLGPVTPIGVGAEEFLRAQHEVRNGIGPITHFDASDLTTRIAGEVDVDVSQYLERKDARRIDRFVHLAIIGAELALKDAGLTPEEVAGERSGTAIGSGIGGLQTWEEQSKTRFDRGAMRLSPFFIPMIIANMSSGQVAMRYQLTGPSTSIVTACASGSTALADAFHTIQRGDADIMFTGGSEAVITPMGIGGFAVMKALSTRNDSPETPAGRSPQAATASSPAREPASSSWKSSNMPGSVAPAYTPRLSAPAPVPTPTTSPPRRPVGSARSAPSSGHCAQRRSTHRRSVTSTPTAPRPMRTT